MVFIAAKGHSLSLLFTSERIQSTVAFALRHPDNPGRQKFVLKSTMNSSLYSGTDYEKKALNEFCERWLKDTFWPFKEFELSLKIPGTFLIFAETSVGSAEDFTGLALGRVMGGVSELFFIYTRPDLRGNGLGRQLLLDFEAHSRASLQAQSVMLEVRPSNDSAIRLYEKSAYKKVGQRKRYYKDGEDALIFEKVLGS
ncbi:MAG: N-acetyltransferase [Proteobacteria bacterium]|nr:MAG: N-acetyltransferase [Pseudomonadota bacterium]